MAATLGSPKPESDAVMLLQRQCSNLSTENQRRIKLLVAYDGTDFCGWAAQKGLRTVRGTLTETVRQISGEENEIIAASRTDGGAHAIGQVCHFDTCNPMNPTNWARVINAKLPWDLVVNQSTLARPQFHSRFWADKRWYRYRIQIGQRDPHRHRKTWNHRLQPSLKLMQSAALRLVGEHDFFGFSQHVDPEANTLRTLYQVKVSQVSDEIRIDIVGTAFLRGMMRRLSGALWEIGRELRPEEDIDRLFNFRSGEPVALPIVLPARGLCLMKVSYGRHPTDKRIFIENEDEE